MPISTRYCEFFTAMSIVSRTIDYPCRETGVLVLCCKSTAFGVRETMANAFFTFSESE